jgi:transcriptional regulator with XRE-family HTH domain
MPKNIHSSARVDGALLKRDRKAAGFTQASFSAECGSVSLVTVRRAEQGHRIIRAYLNSMAEALGHPVERYIIQDDLAEATEYVVSLDGDWTGYFVESDRGALPYVVQEDIELRQTGAFVDGDFTCYCPTEIRRETVRGARVINNVISGTIYPDRWLLPSGLASFVQVVSRNNDWLEGFSIWYDPDSDQIETSRMISVRKRSASYLQYLREARRIMDNDVSMYQLRNLIERGYDFDDAVAMVQAASRSEAGQRKARNQRTPSADMLRIEGAGYLERCNLGYQDLLARLIELDYSSIGEIGNYDEAYEGTVDQWVPIFSEHPDCWRLLTKGDRIVGYWHFLALTPEKIAQARSGGLLDSNLSLADVVALDRPGSYSVYMVTMVCEPKYRSGRAFELLFGSVFEAIELLAANRIFIEDIVFAAWTPMSTRMAERLAFRKIGVLRPVDGQEPVAPVDIFEAKFRDILASDRLEGYQSVRRAYRIE